VLIAAVVGLVFVREGIDEKALRTTLINLHRSLGLCVALLAVVRIAVRLAKRPLPPTADASPLEHFVAMAVHLALYVLMFALPLIGWALSSANGKPVSFFGLVTCRRWSSRTKTSATRSPNTTRAPPGSSSASSAPTRRRPWPTTSSSATACCGRCCRPGWPAVAAEPARPDHRFSPEILKRTTMKPLISGRKSPCPPSGAPAPRCWPSSACSPPPRPPTPCPASPARPAPTAPPATWAPSARS
jgi:hypothetical protein